MKEARFAQLLKNPELIQDTPLSELELLKSQYPYSKNIQLLYLRKLKILGSTQIENEAQLAAIQHHHPMMFTQFIEQEQSTEEIDSINNLYNDIFNSIDEVSETKEDKVESDESENLAEQIKIIENIENPIKSNTLQAKFPSNEEELERRILEQEKEEAEKNQDIHLEQIKAESKKKEKKKLQKLRTIQFDEEQKELLAEVEMYDQNDIQFIKIKKPKSRVIKQVKDKKKKYKNKKKSIKLKKKTRKINKQEIVKPEEKKEPTYIDWLEGLKSTAEVIKQEITSKNKVEGSKKNKSKKKKKKKKGKKLQDKINKSVKRNDKIYTETLAELLEKQGHKKKAIDIYKQLMYNNPEKSDYFAGRINKLK